jgi:hypothetical protein
VTRPIAALAVFSTLLFASDKFTDNRVAPILITRCLGCHNDELKDGDISFNDRESVLKGGKRGPAIVPGKPENSSLIQVIRGEGDLRMPPGPSLSKREITILTEWVKRGAPWSGKLQAKP